MGASPFFCGLSRPPGLRGLCLFAAGPRRGLGLHSCGSGSAELGGGYAPPHPAPTLSEKSRQKAAARRLRQKPLNAGLGAGTHNRRSLSAGWACLGGEFCAVCVLIRAQNRRGFLPALAIAALVRLAPGLGVWPCGRGLGRRGALGIGVSPCGRGLGRKRRSAPLAPLQEAQPAKRAASHPSRLAGNPQASRRAFRPPAVLCAAPNARTQALRAYGAQSGGPGGHPLGLDWRRLKAR